MNQELETNIQEICKRYDDDPTRMMDIVRDVQMAMGFVPGAAMDAIATAVGSHRVEVESVVSFYGFLSKEAHGKVVIRACNDVVDRMFGADDPGWESPDHARIPVGTVSCRLRVRRSPSPPLLLIDGCVI